MVQYFDYNKSKICYYTFGKQSNPAILFLHGWGASSALWIDIFKNFSKAYYLIFIDFAPFGKSGKLKQVWNINTYTNCVTQLLHKENISNYYVVSHSFGFRIALNLALQKQNIIKMVSICGAGIENKPLKIKLKITLYKAKKLLVKCKLLNSKLLQNCGSNDYKTLTPILKETFNNIVKYNFAKLLKYIQTNILLLYSKNDDQISIKQAKTFNKKLQNSSLYLFDGGGHYLFLTQKTAIQNAIKIFFEKGD